MYPRSFLYEEAKIKQRTPLNKELCEIGEEAIWESRFTSVLLNLETLSYQFVLIIVLISARAGSLIFCDGTVYSI